MRTPLVLVTGVDVVAMDSALMSLAWGLPRAVSVRHRIDPHSQSLIRTVSDVTGVLERESVQLAHACVSCALRADIVPTLERVARDGRWSAIVAGLPTATEAGQLAHILTTDTRLARHLTLSGVVAAVATDNLALELLGSDLLRERGVHCNPDDYRGLGEVACAQIEFADVVVLDGDPGAQATDLVRALGRPDLPIVFGADRLDAEELAAQRRGAGSTSAWWSPEFHSELPALESSRAWRLDLASELPFHPERLLDQIERLGVGRHRSRGTFWLPTRPGDILEWSGAGGQLSIGCYGPRGSRPPMNRLVFTGLGAPPKGLAEAFEALLLTPSEAMLDPRMWDVVEDGFEPWLGDIRDAA